MNATLAASWVPCSCEKRIYVFLDPDTLSYHFQHGENPEHRSPEMPVDVNVTDNPDLQITIEGYDLQDGVASEFVAKSVTVKGRWIDAIHAREPQR